MSTARNAPIKKPRYENDPVIERLEIRKIAVSKPSLRIAKNITKKTPHDDNLIASRVLVSSSFLFETFLESQKITYQIRIAVIYKNMPSKRAFVESFPSEFFASITKYPTIILAAMAAPTPSHSFVKCDFRV